MYEKELETIQKGYSLHERTLIRIGFEEALKLTLVQQPLSGSPDGSPKCQHINGFDNHKYEKKFICPDCGEIIKC